MAQSVKNPSTMQEITSNAEDWGSIPGSGRSLGEGNGKSLQFSAWEIPWRKEPGGLQSMRSQESETT